MMVASILLVLLCVSLLIYLIILSLLFRRNKKATYKIVIILFLLFIGLVSMDIWAYNVHTKRAGIIKSELKIGMLSDQIPVYLENNKKRLHISNWRRYDENNKIWFTISIDSPFNFRCLFTGEGGLAIDLDESNKEIKSIKWFM